MILQTPGSPNCGAVSLANALRCLGIFMTEEQAVAFCQTSHEGTDERDLMRGIRKTGMRCQEVKAWHRAEAQGKLLGRLKEGKPCIIIIDDFDHWVTCIGVLGDSVVVVDSTNEGDNPTENGCWVVPVDELCDRWECSPSVSGDEVPFYGLSINL